MLVKVMRFAQVNREFYFFNVFGSIKKGMVAAKNGSLMGLISYIKLVNNVRHCLVPQMPFQKDYFNPMLRLQLLFDKLYILF